MWVKKKTVRKDILDEWTKSGEVFPLNSFGARAAHLAENKALKSNARNKLTRPSFCTDEVYVNIGNQK